MKQEVDLVHFQLYLCSRKPPNTFGVPGLTWLNITNVSTKIPSRDFCIYLCGFVNREGEYNDIRNQTYGRSFRVNERENE